MNRCGTCKYFAKQDFEGLEGKIVCDLLSSSDGRPDHEARAHALDVEQYAACLVVTADFGCVEWVSK